MSVCLCLSWGVCSHVLTHPNPPLVFAFPGMEDAIKKIVTIFLKSSRGKENLDGRSFQKMVSSQFSNIMEVKLSSLHSYLSYFL